MDILKKKVVDKVFEKLLNSQVCATTCVYYVMFLCSAKGKNWLSHAKREPNHALKITPSNEMLAHEKTAPAK